jgi:hypothetical protein
MSATARQFEERPEPTSRPEVVRDEPATQKPPLMTLAAMVVGSMVGAGVFTLPRYAKRREDVGTAAVLGFLGVLQSIVGTWGLVFISIGLIVSVLGAYLAWTLMAAEAVFVAAKHDDLPAFLKRTNPKEVPAAAPLMSTLLIQAVLLRWPGRHLDDHGAGQPGAVDGGENRRVHGDRRHDGHRLGRPAVRRHGGPADGRDGPPRHDAHHGTAARRHRDAVRDQWGE